MRPGSDFYQEGQRIVVPIIPVPHKQEITSRANLRVTSYLENLEMSGNWQSGKYQGKII